MSISEIVKAYEISLKTASPDQYIVISVESLTELDRKHGISGLREQKEPPWKIDHWYTRFAAAITWVLTHPDTHLTHTLLRTYCQKKPLLVAIFAASGYRKMGHIFQQLTETNTDKTCSLSGKKALLYLASAGIDEVTDEMLEVALQQPSDLLLPLMLAWLDQRSILTEQGERNRERLIINSGKIVDASVSVSDLKQISRVWMYCSYASTPRKHEIKHVLNHLIKKLLISFAVSPKMKSRTSGNKGKMVVITEQFMSNHAMYRCYAPLISSLKEYFHLSGLAITGNIDETSKALFNQVILFEKKGTPLQDILTKIEMLSPDVILYPSVGMSSLTILLANLRLAPIQIACQGHPATTCSPEIDYVVTGRLRGDQNILYTEKLLIADGPFIFTQHSELTHRLPERERTAENTVHIAVNSKVMKLSYRLLEICKKLNNESTYPLVFHFFPGERGCNLDGLAMEIREQLENSVVHTYLTYNTLLQELANCDLVLSSFPFGNTNGTVDVCLLGLPNVVHHGAESHSQTDRLVLERAAYPSWLINEDDESYFACALRLINNPDLRRAFVNDRRMIDIRALFFEPDASSLSDNQADLIYKTFLSKKEASAYQ